MTLVILFWRKKIHIIIFANIFYAENAGNLLKTIAESSVDVAKRRCPTVKSWPFYCILVHSAISSITICSSSRVRWSLIFRKPCRTTALWSWKAACSSSSCSSLIWVRSKTPNSCHYPKGKTTSFSLLLLPTPIGMGRRPIHAAFILYKTLGYPELGHDMNCLAPIHINNVFYYCPVKWLSLIMVMFSKTKITKRADTSWEVSVLIYFACKSFTRQQYILTQQWIIIIK